MAVGIQEKKYFLQLLSAGTFPGSRDVAVNKFLLLEILTYSGSYVVVEQALNNLISDNLMSSKYHGNKVRWIKVMVCALF